MNKGIRLFVGGQGGTIQGERDDLDGNRCFSAAHRPHKGEYDCSQLNVLLDSGAFTDPWEQRLTPELALERQLDWEAKASQKWSQTLQAHALVSYDFLIDEVWVGGHRYKERWTVQKADQAVASTIEAATYLANQRQRLSPRALVLACQGVDAMQYEDCVTEVLKAAQPQDWIGLGGWCILGLYKSWLPEFWSTCYRILPRIASVGVKHIHIFGVLYLPALGGLLWLADQYGLSVSTDSTRPLLEATWPDKQKAGCRCDYWRDNVAWWKETLTHLRGSTWYRQPHYSTACRQLSLL